MEKQALQLLAHKLVEQKSNKWGQSAEAWESQEEAQRSADCPHDLIEIVQGVFLL